MKKRKIIKNQILEIPKPKKRRNNKGSLDFAIKDETKEIDNKDEKEILTDRMEIKRDKNNEYVSEDKKNKKLKEKKIYTEQRMKSNENKKIQTKNNEIEYENEVIENNNNYNNYNHIHKNSYQYKNNKKGGRKDIKKNYTNNRKYINYDNTQNNTGYSSNYQQQPKKQITKIKKENNANNLKELFEIEHSKRTEIKEEDSNLKKIQKEDKDNEENTNNINTNNNISINDNNNISNIKIANDEGIEDDFEEEFFDNKRQNQIFNYQLPIDKKMNNLGGEKNEEMNPTFLNDMKTSIAFETEQELMKSIKKDNKDNNNKSNNGELFKEDSDMDFSTSHLNFHYYFFDKEQPQPENDEPEYSGNYEDFKFKSLIENLNNVENNYVNEEKGKFDSLLNNNINISNSNNKEESEDKKDENENEDSFKANDYIQYEMNKIKFDNKFNYFNYDINNEHLNNEDKKFQNKFDECQKSFGRFWKK
jgi:hypothetical protein